MKTKIPDPVRRFIQEVNKHPKISGVIWATFISISVLAVFMLILIREWDLITNFDWSINLGNLSVQAILHLCALLSMFLAWEILLARVTTGIEIRRDLRIYSLSLLARRIPLPIWYIGSRLHLYKTYKVRHLATASATVVEIILIAISGILCYIFLLPVYTSFPTFPYKNLVLIALLILLILILHPSIIFVVFNKAANAFGHRPINLKITRTTLAALMLAYIATWFLDGIGLYFAVISLTDITPPLFDIIGVSTISALVSIILLFLPLGFGIKELTMSALLSIWMPISVSLIVALLYRLIQTLEESLLVLITTLYGKWVPTNQSNIPSDN